MQTWHISLFGNLRVSRDGQEFSRFSTRKTGGLLAYLAFYRDRRHTREVICDLLWPDEAPDKSRARLRVALTSLRHQLEPPGVPSGSVLRTEGNELVQLSGETITTDVAEVEQALQSLDHTSETPRQIAIAQRIASLFSEPLLTGFYEDWVIRERERLSQAVVERLSTLARQLPPEKGLDIAREAARIDPLSEEPLFALLPLLAESGKQGEALRLFQNFTSRYEAALGIPPSEALQALVNTLPAAPVAASEARTSSPSPATPAPSVVSETPQLSRRLPTYLTRFFGREREQVAIHEALGETRCITLTGPGGTGKTRLAVETAKKWEGPCWFVPLAAVEEAYRLPVFLYDALEGVVPARADSDSPEALLAVIIRALSEQAQPPLLILDNLEQIADSAGSPLLRLLESVPNLHLLLTSRLRLHLPGEQEFPLEPLPIPSSEETTSSDDNLEPTTRIASVALFLDRARTARPDFQITSRNRGDILTICRLLEGIPLAIELVAARAGTLVPAQMLTKMTEQGALLTVVDRRARPEDRHRSLRAAIDWSYRLLTAELQHLFTCISVFRGGFTVEAAASVCDISESAAGEALSRLRSHSLVVSVATAAEMRYSLLESLRAFAIEECPAEESAMALHRHIAWCAEFADQADNGLGGPEQASWLERVEADLENLRAAVYFSVIVEPARALQIAGAVWFYWYLRGRPTEGRAWLERVLEDYPETPEEESDSTARFRRARALHGAGTLAWIQGDSLIAQTRFNESLRLRRLLGDEIAVAASLNNLGLLAWSRRDLEEARRFHREALAIRRKQGNLSLLASSLQNLGVVEWDRGDYPASRASSEEALALCRVSGDRVGEGHALNNLGNIALALSDFEAARDWYTQSLSVKRQVGYEPGIAATLSNLGVTSLYQQRHAEAEASFEEALTIYREMNSPTGIATQLRNLGQIATQREDWERAFALLTESFHLHGEADNPADIAGNMEAFALYQAARGNADSAARLMGAAAARRQEIQVLQPPSERALVERGVATARLLLGQEAFDTAYAAGATLSRQDILTLIARK
jgi:predicted ATPase/DNA-binding SARP family transcriptional activator/Tfp pilus assembly protein PilF